MTDGRSLHPDHLATSLSPMLTTKTRTLTPPADEAPIGLFKVEEFDGDRCSYVARKWRTSEAEARRFFARFYIAESPNARLVGNGGLVLVGR